MAIFRLNYLNQVQIAANTLSRNRAKSIIQRFPKTKTEKLIEACSEQVSLQPQYCEPWIVFDRDEVPNFDRIIRDAERCGIHVGWSNPCIEIWFDAYFGTMHADWLTSPVCCQRFGDIFEKRTEQEYIVLTEQWEKARKPLKILGKTGIMR